MPLLSTKESRLYLTRKSRVLSSLRLHGQSKAPQRSCSEGEPNSSRLKVRSLRNRRGGEGRGGRGEKGPFVSKHFGPEGDDGGGAGRDGNSTGHQIVTLEDFSAQVLTRTRVPC